MKVGRNQPCPCGSGKKYKLCCLNGDNVRVTGIAWRRMRRTEGKLGPLLGSHAVEHYGPQSLIEAWDEFTLWEDVPLDLDEPMLEFETAFQSWWVYQWIPDDTKRLGELRPPEMPVALHYLAKRGTRMDAFTRRFIEEACSQPFSFFIVRDVTPGVGMSIRDLLSKREFEVYERRASQELEKGSIIFSQVVTLDGDSILLGVAPYVIPPSYAGLFLDMREDLAFDGLKGVDLLSECDFELRETYFDIRSDLLDPQLDQEIGDDPDALPVQTSTSTEGDLAAVRGSLEARSLLAETPDDHWVAWLDASLPVLNDETPREAARTEIGRERLEALLWHLDWINTGLPHEPDVDRLREELGIG